MTKACDGNGKTAEYDYDKVGNLTSAADAAGTVTFTYDALYRTTEINDNGSIIGYAYDDAGNLTSENRSGVDIDKRDELVRYYYDKADQLVKTNVEGEVTEYAYDLAGNLLSDGESSYTYDQQNRLLTRTDADGTTTYEYDAAGNLVKETNPDGTVSYTYNAQNKLIKGELSDGESSTYTYNALGVRIENVQVRANENAGNQNADLTDGSHGVDYLDFLKDGRADWQRAWESEIGTTHQTDFETVTRYYVVDYLSVANRDLVVTEDGSYATRYAYDPAGTRISAEFAYADGTARGDAGENLQSDVAAELHKVWYRTSMLGSTLFAVDADGEVVAHAIYDAWGSPLVETYTDANLSGLENLNNFTGYTYDETLGLYFAQNRFYDATTHRFTQEDPIRDGGNWYAYCGNNPVNNIDPLGEILRSLFDLAAEYQATITWSSNGTKVEEKDLEKYLKELYTAEHSNYKESSVSLSATVTLNGQSKTYVVAEKKDSADPLTVEQHFLRNDYDVMINDLSFAHDWNRVYNSAYESSIVYSNGYITNQYTAPFTQMRYGVTTMNGVACELIAIYNALNKVGAFNVAGHKITISEIADFYEGKNLGMRWNGRGGTQSYHIDEYFMTLGCISLTDLTNEAWYYGNGIVSYIGYEFLSKAVDTLLTDQNALILSVVNDSKFGFGVVGSIHTFTAVREQNGNIVFYNSYDVFSGPQRRSSVADFMRANGITTILRAYLIEKK